MKKQTKSVKIWFPKNGFLCDFQRIYSEFQRKDALNITVAPVVVSLILSVIFLLRGTPQDTFSDYVFFSTIYLFLMGLLFSCQSINGRIDSGEWAYWVLGIRRSAHSYVFALLLWRSIQTVISAFFFVITLWAVIQCTDSSWMFPALVCPYFCTGTETVCPSLIAMLTGNETALTLAKTAPDISLAYKVHFLFSFGIGVTIAGISGVFLGVFFSIVCKKRFNSILLSVTVIMLSMTLSFVSFRPTPGGQEQDRTNNNMNYSEENTYKFKPEGNAPPLFLPCYYSWKELWTYDNPGKILWPDIRYLSKDGLKKTPSCSYWEIKLAQILSYLLPQRYFFNIAHATVPRLGTLSRGERLGQSGRTHNTHFCSDTTPKERRCRCIYCLNMVPQKPFHLLRDETLKTVSSYQFKELKQRLLDIDTDFEDAPLNPILECLDNHNRHAFYCFDEREGFQTDDGLNADSGLLKMFTFNEQQPADSDIDKADWDNMIACCRLIQSDVRKSRSQQFGVLKRIWWKTVLAEISALSLGGLLLIIVMYFMLRKERFNVLR